jgi:ring-1,2-phenylacetyl-CoA epoxidase subunit PaaB
MKGFLVKYFYGDYGDKENAAADSSGDLKAASGPPVPVQTEVGSTATAVETGAVPSTAGSWPLWEVFIRSKQGLDHKHVGSLHAADAAMAIENARDVYTRRQEGISIWVVASVDIHASDPAEAASLYDPANDKIYRHPSFYELPDELKHM